MIIAVDFDGIIAEDEGNFPSIGEPIVPMIDFIKELIEGGHEVVLWTCRTGGALLDAVEWCENHGLQFCSINENAPSNRRKYAARYPGGTRKVSADIYLDDHSIGFMSNVWEYRSRMVAIAVMIQQTRRLIECDKR